MVLCGELSGRRFDRPSSGPGGGRGIFTCPTAPPKPTRWKAGESMSNDPSVPRAVTRLLACAVALKRTAERLEKWADGDVSDDLRHAERPRFCSLLFLQNRLFRSAMISLESLEPEMHRAIEGQFSRLIRGANGIDSDESTLWRVLVESQAIHLARDLRDRIDVLVDKYGQEKVRLSGQTTEPRQAKRKRRKPVKQAIMCAFNEHPGLNSPSRLLPLVNDVLASWGYGPTTLAYLKKCLRGYAKEHERQKKVK